MDFHDLYTLIKSLCALFCQFFFYWKAVAAKCFAVWMFGSTQESIVLTGSTQDSMICMLTQESINCMLTG